jgi:hypothetical protein
VQCNAIAGDTWTTSKIIQPHKVVEDYRSGPPVLSSFNGASM